MPTGYTAKLIESGQPFNEFAMLCARAMGACIMLRDDPMDAAIPEFKPSTFYIDKLEQAKAERARLLSMTDEERIKFGQEEKDKAIKSAQDWLAREHMANIRLQAMRDKVLQWNPPTSEHVGLKDFMLDQIKISMNDLAYIEARIVDAQKSFARDYYDNAVKSASEGIPRYEEEDRKERERTASRNRWINELRASLS